MGYTTLNFLYTQHVCYEYIILCIQTAGNDSMYDFGVLQLSECSIFTVHYAEFPAISMQVLDRLFPANILLGNSLHDFGVLQPFVYSIFTVHFAEFPALSTYNCWISYFLHTDCWETVYMISAFFQHSVFSNFTVHYAEFPAPSTCKLWID